MRQILASALFRALSERSDALETEDEGRSLHGRIVGGGPKICSALLIATALALPSAADAAPAVTCFGGHGDSTLVGTSRDDVLGGPGADVANGNQGTDACVNAETVFGCELDALVAPATV